MSLFSDFLKNVETTVNKAYRDAEDAINRQLDWAGRQSDLVKAGLGVIIPGYHMLYAYESLKGVVSEATEWARAHSGYDHISNEAENSYWVKAGLGVMSAPLGATFVYEDARKKIVYYSAPYVYKAGYWLGERYRANEKYAPFAAAAGMFIPQTFMTAFAAEEISGGAATAGYIDSFMKDPVELTDPLKWNYRPEQYGAYKWYPGSFEWNASGAGGALYSSTGLIEPWEKMNNRRQDYDNTGFMMSSFYDFNMPAAPGLTYAGSPNFMDIYG